MNSESMNAETSVVVEIHPESTTSENTAIVASQTEAIVEVKLDGADNEVQRETQALIEAIKKRGQAEIQAAGNLSQEAYLKAIRQARETIEQSQLVIDPHRLEQTMQVLQTEADKSWHVIVGEIESMGIRLADTAKLAWSNLMKPHS
jgi:hypothetical protein